MRKNFLLLFLMALLPLAGWAASLDETQFSATNITFGTSTLPTVSGGSYTEGDDYVQVTDVFYGEKDDDDPIPVANLATTPVGKYYIKVNGAGSYIGQSVYVDFWINGIAVSSLTITVAADPAPTYTGSQLKPAVTVKNAGTTLTLGTDYTLTYGENINAGTTAGSVKITGKGNYSGETTETFEIAKKAFTTANITVTITGNEVTYDGTDTQTANVVVADKVLGTLTSDSYTVTYADGHENAGTYAITVKGKGNYKEETINPGVNLVIKKAPVLVTPKATKVYDGTKDLPVVENTAFEYSGFVKGETASDVAVGSTTWESDANLTKNVKDGYVLKVKVNDFSVTGDNYTFTPMPGTLNITKKDVEIYANDQEVAYGADIDTGVMTVEDLSGSITGWSTAKTGDLACLKRAVIVYKDGNKLKVKANDAAAAADKTVLANYNPKYNTNGGSAKFGTLSTTKAVITIALNSNVTLTKDYDGEPAAIEEDVTDEDNLTIVGEMIGDDELDLSKLTATVAANEGAVNTDPGYKVTLSGAAVSANADKYTINYVTTYYKVTQKALNITITPQSILKGADPTAEGVFDKELFAIKDGDMAEGEDPYEIFELALKDGALSAGKVNTAGNYIYLKAKSGKEPAAANYSGWGEDGTLGALVVPAATTIILDVEDAIETIDDNIWSEGDDTQTVTFSTRSLTTDTWNAMVLPFDIEVADLSKKFGYCIVNILNETTSKQDAVRFKLYMGKIEAGTPFLIKYHGVATNLNQITIDNVKIKGTDINNVTADGGKVTFTGQFERNESGDLGKNVIFPYNTADNGKWIESDGTAQLPGFNAYIIYPEKAAAPRIYVEDIEGNTTVIRQISAQSTGAKDANSAEGWYNLNGMKLQGAPAQKGVFIQNGKKYVVK